MSSLVRRAKKIYQAIQAKYAESELGDDDIDGKCLAGEEFQGSEDIMDFVYVPDYIVVEEEIMGDGGDGGGDGGNGGGDGGHIRRERGRKRDAKSSIGREKGSADWAVRGWIVGVSSPTPTCWTTSGR